MFRFYLTTFLLARMFLVSMRKLSTEFQLFVDEDNAISI